jgi:hypothetical protein
MDTLRAPNRHAGPDSATHWWKTSSFSEILDPDFVQEFETANELR